jgi:UDPglucose 6-dehydrogenase
MHLDVVGDTVCAFVTASEMARTGNQVTHHVTPGAASAVVSGGTLPYAEPGLQEQIDCQRAEGRLTLRSFDPTSNMHGVIFFSLQPDQRDHAVQLVDQMTCDADTAPLLVNQSAFAVGTCEMLQSRLRARFPDAVVIALPDVLQEGVALAHFQRPGHILLGCDSEPAELVMRNLLRPFNRRRDVIQVMSSREAEFSKLAISGMLATRLSFMNDMAGLAEQVNVDIEQVRRGLAADPRIGDAYLYPGCGFGGPGFSRDVMSLADTLKGSDLGAELLERVLEINERQKEVLFRKFWRHFQSDIAGRCVALWGVSFKPGTNRIQNAPALALIEALRAQDVRVQVHDPMALDELRTWLGDDSHNVAFCDTPEQACSGADALMLVTEWKQYWSPDWEHIRQVMKTPLVLDGRNVYDPAFLRSKGFLYQGVGRI